MKSKVQFLHHIGFGYRKADAQTREQFTISPILIPSLKKAFLDIGVDKFFVLSTCNRSEIYYVHHNASDIHQVIQRVFSINNEVYNPYVQLRQGEKVVRHLFHVAAGLDSQITGDYDIVNQIKEAFTLSKSQSTLDAFLERLINNALYTSKIVKRNTSLSDGRTSVSYAASHFVTQLGMKESDHLLLLGTGNMGTAFSRHFKTTNPNFPLILLNRTYERAEKLAKEFSHVAIGSIENLESLIPISKYIVVATSALQSYTLPEKVFHSNHEHHIIDLTVPSNVDPKVSRRSNIHYYDIDTISLSIKENIERRIQDIPKAEEIVNQSVGAFLRWDQRQQFSPYLKLTKDHLLKLQEQELCPYLDINRNQDRINEIIKTLAKQTQTGSVHACDYINAFQNILENPNQENSLIKIGTRDSILAIYQSQQVEKSLKKLGVNCVIEATKSAGDLNLEKPIYELGIEGVFTKSLDKALINHKVDVAVHSLKDVPTKLAKGITIGAVLPRAAHEDIAICKAGIEWTELNKLDITVATGSIRRRAMWSHRYPHHQFANVRGNIQTRLKKFYEGDCDVFIMAKAAYDRLQLSLENTHILDFLPAPSQGIIAVCTRVQDTKSMELCEGINHQPTLLAASIERKFLFQLQGGCTSPIGAYAKIEADKINFKAEVLSSDGSKCARINKSISLVDFHLDIVKDWATEIKGLGAAKILEMLSS